MYRIPVQKVSGIIKYRVIYTKLIGRSNYRPISIPTYHHKKSPQVHKYDKDFYMILRNYISWCLNVIMIRNDLVFNNEYRSKIKLPEKWY